MEISKKLKWRLIVLAIIIKVSYLFFFAYYQPGVENISNQIYGTSGDLPDYIEPVENLISEGRYYFGNNNFAGRMPGYTFVLFPLRFFFSQENALTITVFLQAILSGISVFFLAMISLKLSGKKLVFGLVYILFLLSTYVSNWDRYILTESFAASSLIFSIHFFQKFLSEGRKWNLFFSGLLFTWAIFLRPFLAPALLIFLLIIFFKYRQIEFKSFLVAAFIFLSSFILFDGLWIYRNYRISGDFIPLQSSITKGGKTSKPVETLNNFITSFGGDRIPWHPGSEAMWFTSDDYLRDHGYERPSDDIFPKFIFSESLTLDSLKLARDYLHNSQSKEIKTEKEEGEIKAIDLLIRLTEHVKVNYPFRYYIGSRLKIMIRFVVLQPYTYYFPYGFSEAGVLGKGIKIVNYFLNFFIVIFGLLSIPFFLKFQNDVHLFFLVFPLFILFLFPMILQINEYRFLVLAYPFLLVNCTLLINKLLVNLKSY